MAPTPHRGALALLALAGALAGCEGYRCSLGVVTDASSGVPLAGVECDASDSEGGTFEGATYDGTQWTTQVLTNEQGEYRVCGEFGGCIPTCPDIDVRFRKEGYLRLTRKNPSDVALTPEAGAPDG